MTQLYLVLGNSNSRKSSLIRCLTGYNHRKIYSIETELNGSFDIYVDGSALQEQQPVVLPEDYCTMISEHEYKFALVTMWIKKGISKPGAKDYIEHFVKFGLQVCQVVVLGASQLDFHIPLQASKVVYIPNSSSIASNAIAKRVRVAWGWI